VADERVDKKERSGLARFFGESPPVRSLSQRLAAGVRLALVEGMSAPAAALLSLALGQNRPITLLVGSQDAGERAADAISAFTSPGNPWYLVGHSSAFLEEGGIPAASPASADRLAALDGLSRLEASSRFSNPPNGALTISPESAIGKDNASNCLIIATMAGALQHTYSPDAMRAAVIRVAPGAELNLPDMLNRLVNVGYQRVDMTQQTGEFSVRGGILDVYPAGASAPVRLDLFGDQVDSIRSFDPETQRSTGTLRSLRILPACEPASRAASTLLDFLPADALLLVDDASALRHRWQEFEGEVRDQIEAMKVGGGEARFPFLSLTKAIGEMERFQTVFLNPLSHNVPWGKPDLTLSINCEPAPRVDGDLNALAEKIIGWRQHEVTPWLFSHQWPRLAEVLRARGIAVTEPGSHLGIVDSRRGPEETIPPKPPPTAAPGAPTAFVQPGSLAEGVFVPSARLVILSDNEIFGGVKMRRSRRTFREGAPLTSLLELRPGDMVVHIDHGIGLFRGLKSMEVEGVQRDYLQLEYAQGDRLFVPSDQIARVQRYIGSEDHPPAIHRLGGGEWSRTKRRVREAVEDMAKELIALYAARSSREGHAFGPDSPWQTEMEEAFVYEETNDQLKAIQDIKDDLESDQPMDRLVCGDVGYGKTEIAIRAAFKVVMEGKQAAVLVPTTVLAQQHLNTFTERLSGFPARIEMLSRFRSRREQLKIVEALKQGSVDIVIGTHRLLSNDVGFKDLGLVVVDEEQRFGVGHKEKLKQLKQMVDVLTLTATPIPRTLHMALSTIRDMSVMNQAPEGRTAIRTYLREYSDDLVRQCILRELERDGQVYVVNNRIENLPRLVESLRALVPRAKIAMAHGQMPEQLLEEVMLDFYEQRYDVLCCTTIIESGLDIPNVNTIIVNDADRLGLAQLYQLRGRVGRSNRQAFCYLLFKPDKELTEIAQKRLHALREFSDLGSGFRIALRDLEIRGAGNLLGSEQHGAMMSVGFDLYCQMIADAVRALKNEPPPPPPLPPVDLPIAAYLPAEYIPADGLRIELYKRFNASTSAEEIVALQEEIVDRFGAFPAPVRNLLAILRLRLQARDAGVTSIAPEKTQVVIRLGPRLRLAPPAITSLQNKHRGTRFLTDRVVIPLGSSGALAPVSAVMQSLLAIRQRRRAMGLEQSGA